MASTTIMMVRQIVKNTLAVDHLMKRLRKYVKRVQDLSLKQMLAAMTKLITTVTVSLTAKTGTAVITPV